MRTAAAARGDEARSFELDRVDWRVVPDLHAQRLGAAVVGVDQGLAAAHEEGVGARNVQRAGERRLEAHAVPRHPRSAGRRRADGETRQRLVGLAAGDLLQVLPELLFRVGVDQHVLWRIVHAAKVAGVLRVASAPLPRRRFQKNHRGPRLASRQRSAECGVASPNDQHVHHDWVRSLSAVAIARRAGILRRRRERLPRARGGPCARCRHARTRARRRYRPCASSCGSRACQPDVR